MSLWPLLLSYQKGPTWLLIAGTNTSSFSLHWGPAGSILHPAGVLFIFHWTYSSLLSLAPVLKCKPVENVTTDSPGLAVEASIFETIQRQMNMLLLLNTSWEELRAQVREGSCSHYFSHLVAEKLTVGTFQNQSNKVFLQWDQITRGSTSAFCQTVGSHPFPAISCLAQKCSFHCMKVCRVQLTPMAG